MVEGPAPADMHGGRTRDQIFGRTKIGLLLFMIGIFAGLRRSERPTHNVHTTGWHRCALTRYACYIGSPQWLQEWSLTLPPTCGLTHDRPHQPPCLQ